MNSDSTPRTMKILELIANAQANPALRAHAALLRDMHQAAKEEVAELKQKVLELEAENYRLKQETTRQKKSQEFIEKRGVLFKRGSDGRIEPDAYCKTCFGVLMGIDDLPLYCGECRWHASITTGDIPETIASI